MYYQKHHYIFGATPSKNKHKALANSYYPIILIDTADFYDSNGEKEALGYLVKG